MQDIEQKMWDVVVIGGGASGMMAAATAAANGAVVCLLEKNADLGKKLRITGGGRCNVTNNKRDDQEMLSMYKGRGKFLFSTFSQHNVIDTVSWFNERQVTLKEENEGRMFPVTDSAETIYEALVTELTDTKVVQVTNTPVTAVEKQPNGTFLITSKQGTSYTAKRIVLATGGTSRPETGSTGDGFQFAQALGHTVRTNDVALVPLVTEEDWVAAVSGVTLQNVKLTMYVDDTKVKKEIGKILFTHKGVSGPTILNMSKEIGEWLQSDTVVLELDLFPQTDVGGLRQLVTTIFHDNSNKKVRNVLGGLAPSALGKVLLKLAGIDSETPCHSIRVEEKNRLVDLMKGVPLTIAGLMGNDKAIISSGGVRLEEIDFKTMESTIVPGLYITGDMLDIDRPSGGYSLQLCWSTGFVAGTHAAK
jgi:predicted Rossmann fold flavoprotein